MAAPALWYLGIGSMMNPQKFIDRGMKPLESRPVLCVDFVRRFWGKFRMAEIREQKGAEFHAVVHRMSLEDIAKLDKMERGYIRKDIVCFTYDGTRIVASGYQFDLATIMFNGHTPPSERYLNLMVSGMEYYGCYPAAIQEMRATPTQGPGSR